MAENNCVTLVFTRSIPQMIHISFLHIAGGQRRAEAVRYPTLRGIAECEGSPSLRD